MLSKIVKTAKFMADWLGWALIYPLWRTEAGREAIISYALELREKDPEKFKAFSVDAEKFLADFKKLAALAAVKNASPKAHRSKATGGGFTDLFVDEVEEDRNDIIDIKTKLGLKKS